jgi:hypothetical protein
MADATSQTTGLVPPTKTADADKVKADVQAAAQATPAKSDDDKASAEAEAAAEVEAHPRKGLYVLYLGPRNAAIAAAADEYKKRSPRLGEGTKAEITSAQWGEVGLPTKRSHTWDLFNNWQIPATQFTNDQIDYLLTNSQRFELVNAAGEKVDSVES